MPKVSLPSRSGVPRVGLAVLWESEPVHIESFWTRAIALLSILGTRLRAAPLAALAAVVSLTAVVTLSFLMIVIATNIRRGLSHGTEQVSIRIIPLAPEGAEQLSGRLAKLPNVAKARVITQAQALEEFSDALGGSRGLLEGLEKDNPLPTTIELSLSNLGAEPEKAVVSLVEQLHRQEGVSDVVYNSSLISSLGELMRGVKFFGIATVVAVLLIGALLVGMTIRLGVFAHRHEIEVMQLVGADRRQIQLPFIIEGLGVGFCASLLSYGILVLCVSWLGTALATSQVGWILGGEALAIAPLIGLAVFFSGPMLSLIGAIWAVRMQGER